jgi:uncharacterized repeat protein (TIGR01451 family)
MSVNPLTSEAPRVAIPEGRRRLRHCLVACVVAVTAMLSVAPGALAVTPAAHWAITSTAAPSNFTSGDSSGTSTYQVTIINDGGAPTDGSQITVSDFLPPGLTVNPTPPDSLIPGFVATPESNNVIRCEDPGPPAICTIAARVVYPGEDIVVLIPVNIAGNVAGSVTNHATVSGGGAPDAAADEQTPISSTPSSFGFQSSQVSAIDAAGAPETRAGSHPYQLNLGFQLNTLVSGAPAENLKDVTATLPEGLVVDPSATPVRCTETQFEAHDCPDASAVGIVQPTSGFPDYVDKAGFEVPLYNLVPPAGVPAAFGFDPLGLSIFIHLFGGVDPAGDYQLTAEARDLPAFGLVSGANVYLWGNPSDPSHDQRRGQCGGNYQDFFGISSCPVVGTDTPLLTMPSACSASLAASFRGDSRQHPGVMISTNPHAVDETGAPLGVTDCSRLAFDPSISVAPDVTVADSPSGLDVRLQIPQSRSQGSPAVANLKTTTVTLPAGMSVSPSAADGLAGCSSAQIRLHEDVAPSCSDGSKIGTVKVTTPLLDDPLEGSVYLASQNDNPSHSVLGLYIVAEGSGVRLKLAGHVHADAAMGQLTTTFDNNPQLPFSELALHFNGGPRAALATPEACGSYTAVSTLSPWSGTAPVSLNSPFTIGSGCGGGFSPAFTAGMASPAAAASSTFTLKVSRADGEQHIRSLTTTLPSGLLARVGSVALCGDAAAAAGTCGAGSQIGSTDASAGPGSNPFHIAGKVFLTGPYKGAPYGLSIVVPAVAGPFNLGTVVVRAAISVDPLDAHVTAVSDDVPDLLAVTGDDGDTDGFPLRVRSIAVTIDRPDFMLNPTSCAPTSIAATLGSWGGASSSASSRFQVGDCQALGLSPKLAISLTGKGQTTDDKHPGVHAVVSQTKGQANLKKVVVSLPLSLALDPDNAQALCEFTDGSKIDPTCPKGSIVGKAVARTPILDQPLSGPVYFVKNVRKDPKSGREIRTLPKLVIPLTGENGLRLNLVGTSNVVDNRLVTTFDNIPDAPVSDFTLDIDGGKSGILVVSGTDICKATQVAEQQVDGQNGKTADGDVYLKTTACSLKILSKKVGKTSVAVKIGGLGAGKVTVSGKGIKKTSKTITKSTVATITAKRTKGKPGKVTVSFDPTGPAKAHKTTK